MKLFGTLTSPFVRKVRIAACEVGQAGSIEFVVSSLTPIHRDLEIVSANPSGRVPTLILDDGAALYDSRVICRYLDSCRYAARSIRKMDRSCGIRCAAKRGRWIARARARAPLRACPAARGTALGAAGGNPARQG